jgi:rhodanese-related sulfurtransferase
MITNSARTPLLVAVLIAVLAPATIAAQAPSTGREVPKEKQTTLGLYVTAVEAYEKWKAAPPKVKILDVRTPEEFIFIGHPTGAWLVPLLLQTHQWDAAKKHLAMKPNPDFVAQVKAVAAPEDTLLIICRSGGRSAKAVNLLAEAGFKNAYTVTDGMEGDVVDDPASVFHGKRMKNGWKNAGLSWTFDQEPERMRLPAVPAEESRGE